MKITEIAIKLRGSKNYSHYNVYVDSNLIKDNQTWSKICDFLKSRAYPSLLYGRGMAKRHPFYCSLHHSCNHLRGLCPFPIIPGWNGGKRCPLPSPYARNKQTPQSPYAPRNRFPTTSQNMRPLPHRSI